ncbi:hypothetical protein BCR33DRAFT_742176 [Rhizoclosmatium globosum]|uniref:Uncharacterized protein n=1 Tax=Rhizoclosmatium globosum TaxID=329046 RepID=A0A1Y2BSD1_9FUNG|nr:hypothetical protein BCR33DRAFT_742176 [Rhizoclosmatium globosum]|eukprot:ORY37661.1 hypothetical protein BCR33DRAFT_742176 [Rhizoclosmatium globosum]
MDTEIEAVSKELEGVITVLSNPEAHWEALSSFEKAMHENALNWFKSMDKRSSSLRERELLLLQIQLERDKNMRPELVVTSLVKEEFPLRPDYPVPVLETNEGLPGVFRTMRDETVKAFTRLLFPEAGGVALPVVFICGPPMSGKTGLAQLLTSELRQAKNRSVVFLRAQQSLEDEPVSAFFERKTQVSWTSFLAYKGERVLIVDEAQVMYDDINFWTDCVKSCLGGAYGELRMVLLSSFGCFESGAPIQFPGGNTFSLMSTSDSENLNHSIVKPSLSLKRAEFKEMANGTLLDTELGWNLCANHVGVAKEILQYVQQRFNNCQAGEVNPAEVELLLRSRDLISHISKCRGMPLFMSVNAIIHNYNLNSETSAKMTSVLESVADGKDMKVVDVANTLGGSAAIEVLTKHGFLFENEDGCLQFASQMHLKVWLESNRRDPTSFPFGFKQIDKFLAKAISRMSSSRLQAFRVENGNLRVRERQIQMELYRTIVTLLPISVLVTPEWQTSTKKGYLDLVVRFQGGCWFLELLVDGVNAGEHAERFTANRKYNSSLLPNSMYALIDFRESVTTCILKPNFSYVKFTPEYLAGVLYSASGEQHFELSP